MSDLSGRLAAARQRAEAAAAARPEFALAAARGDVSAKRQLDKLAKEQAEAERELVDLALALGQEQAAERESRRESAEREADRQYEEGKRLVTEIRAAAAEMDAAAKAMCAAKLKIDVARALLQRTNTIPGELIGRLVARGGWTRALAHHCGGWAEFPPIGTRHNFKDMVETALARLRRPIVGAEVDAA